MDAELIRRHNEVVTSNDIVVHAGDFCWCTKQEEAQKYIRQLKGNHIFIKGSHDSWLPSSAKYMWRKMIEGQFIVVCHYAMRTWERAHHGSWQLYGHWHEDRGDEGLQCNVCVDGSNFYPRSFDEIKKIMKPRAEDFLRKREGKGNE
jgi:calcineurin-like phosphoesterase family protein